jgi:hypothetical protein
MLIKTTTGVNFIKRFYLGLNTDTTQYAECFFNPLIQKERMRISFLKGSELSKTTFREKDLPVRPGTLTEWKTQYNYSPLLGSLFCKIKVKMFLISKAADLVRSRR